MAPDPWLSLYEATSHLAQDIAENIHEHNRYLRNGENPAKLNMTVRHQMHNLKEKISQLKQSLLKAVSMHQITQLEGDRRQNLVDELLTRERQMLATFKNDGTEPDLIRSSLMAGGGTQGVINPWLMEEPEETRGLGFGEIKQQQQRIIQEQDAGLDALSAILSRQKQMGHGIGNELEEQNGLVMVAVTFLILVFETPSLNLLLRFPFPFPVLMFQEIIDDLTNLVENTDGKIRSQTRHIKIVDKKSTSCGMLVVIVLLLIAIVVVAVWPTS